MDDAKCILSVSLKPLILIINSLYWRIWRQIAQPHRCFIEANATTINPMVGNLLFVWIIFYPSYPSVKRITHVFQWLNYHGWTHFAVSHPSYPSLIRGKRLTLYPKCKHWLTHGACDHWNSIIAAPLAEVQGPWSKIQDHPRSKAPIVRWLL